MDSYLTSRPRPIMPVGEVQYYQTYGIRAGQDTAVVAACKDVGCQNWLHGWEIALDESDTNQAFLAKVARNSGRTFRETRAGDGKTVFRFEPFQRCFEEHRTRPDIFTRRHGDWRGNPSGQVFTHTRPQDWVEDFAENQQRLNEAKQKG